MNDLKHKWISLVKMGQLDKAYSSYLDENPFHAFSKTMPLRAISSLLSLVLAYWMKRTKPVLDLDDEAVDLSEEFVIFWKCPDIIGRMLLGKIVFYYFSNKKIPARALGWYGHWLVFQGRYHQAAFFFKYLQSRVVKRSRLHGEILSLSGNYFYSRKNFNESVLHHKKADEILKSNNDKFFQMFNLGTSAKTYAEQGELEIFKTAILGGFDHLNPMEPDERYGMRVLIYYAYLNFIHDNIELGKQFYVSAESCYSTSGSSLDKAIYCAYKAVILIFFRDLGGARRSIKLAQNHISDFGTYKSHEELIDSIDQHLHKGDAAHPLINNLLGMDSKAKSSELESWYRNFFATFLPILERIQFYPIEQIVHAIEVTCHAKVEFDTRDNILSEDVENAHFEVLDCIDGNTVFTFHLFHEGKLLTLRATTSTKKWRNLEIFESTRSTLYLLHSLSKQEHLKSITHIQEQKLKEADLAKRIAHDIKSPLAALQLTLSKIAFQNADLSIVRASTQKIEDIVHDLNRKQGRSGANEVKKVLVKSFMDTLLADKRVEYQGRAIEFILNYHNGSKAKFIEVNELEMYRTLSNVINNAVESYDGSGTVNIDVSSSHGLLEIAVQDYGRGIDEGHLDLIFEKDVSFKKNGSGLGLFYAKIFLENNSGSISVSSRPSVGTVLTIRFPVCTSPSLFKTSFILEDYDQIVIADDFSPNIEMIHQKILKHCPGMQIRSYMSLSELSSFIDNERPLKTFFIIDYNFQNDSSNGLDFIIERGLKSCSVLATHHYEDEKVLRSASELGVKVLPKALVEDVQIYTKKPYMLIADDETYFLTAISHKLKDKYKIITCSTAEEVLKLAPTLPRNTFFFVDRNFEPSQMRGEDIFAGLFELGRLNLYNISGDSSFHNEHAVKIEKTEIEDYLI